MTFVIMLVGIEAEYVPLVRECGKYVLLNFQWIPTVWYVFIVRLTVHSASYNPLKTAGLWGMMPGLLRCSQMERFG